MKIAALNEKKNSKSFIWKKKILQIFFVSNQKSFSGRHSLLDELFFTEEWILVSGVVLTTCQKKVNNCKKFGFEKKKILQKRVPANATEQASSFSSC